jgi:hypothetical protein
LSFVIHRSSNRQRTPHPSPPSLQPKPTHKRNTWTPSPSGPASNPSPLSWARAWLGSIWPRCPSLGSIMGCRSVNLCMYMYMCVYCFHMHTYIPPQNFTTNIANTHSHRIPPPQNTHTHTQTNTFLVGTEQSNEWGEDFAKFFLERRLIPQLMVSFFEYIYKYIYT